MSVRIGFIGVGGIAASHLVNLMSIPKAEVVALCDLSTEQIEATRERVNRRLAGAPRQLEGVAYNDYRSMLRNENLDAVYLCLPPFAHGDPEEAVIEAGVPMLVEKPVALELGLAHRLNEAIQEKSLMVATGYQTRYASHVQKAKELLEGQTIGMTVVMRFGKTPAKGWYGIQKMSGGQLVEQATHQVDLLRYLIGEITTVYAAAGTRINNKNQPDYDIFDVNCMTLTFEDGSMANFANNLIAAYGSPTEARGMHIFCDGMTLSIGSSLRVITAEGTEEIPGDSNPMAGEDEAFVEAVAQGRPELILSDYENGVRTLAVTLAGEQSARTGQPVTVASLMDDGLRATS